MTSTIDLAQKERDITSQAVKKLRAAVRAEVSHNSQSKTGQALRMSGASSRFKKGRLQRIIMSGAYYTLMQHYGFEGQKSNGVNQRLRATDVFAKAVSSSNILEKLADDISELRIEQVAALIQFSR